MKRVISLLLVLTMAISLLPMATHTAKAGQYDYKLTFNANGGHIGSESGPATKTVTLSQYNFAAGYECSKTTAYRSGYKFLGWYDANGKKYTSGVSGSPATVYAKWSQLPTYTVKYNANGGVLAPPSQKKTQGVPLKLTTSKPTLPGATFAGWATSANAKSPTYYAGSTYKNDCNAVLYAVYKCTVNIIIHGRTFTTNNVPHKEKLSEILKGAYHTDLNKGYTRHWYNNDSGTEITSNEVVGVSRTVYCKDIPNYTEVIFSYGGGATDETKKIYTGNTIKSVINKNTDASFGKFIGWSPYKNGLDPNGSGHYVVYSPDYEWLALNNGEKKTLYAQYIKNNQVLLVDYIMSKDELVNLRDTEIKLYNHTKDIFDHNQAVKKDLDNRVIKTLWAALNEFPGFSTCMAICGCEFDTNSGAEEFVIDMFTLDKLNNRCETLRAKVNALKNEGLHEVTVYTRISYKYKNLYKEILNY